ncbi:hypothetical protein RCL1_006774 [Eukaryota sp. TZLM3-RCL]
MSALSISDWQLIASFFQLKETPSDEDFLLIVSMLSGKRAYKKLLRNVLSFGLVCFPWYSTFCQVNSLVDFDVLEVTPSTLQKALLPYIAAATDLMTRRINGLTLVRRILENSSSNKYALLGLLYHVQERVPAVVALDYFFHRNEIYHHRLFCGVWRSLFRKLVSSNTMEVLSDRCELFPRFLFSIYNEYSKHAC